MKKQDKIRKIGLYLSALLLTLTLCVLLPAAMDGSQKTFLPFSDDTVFFLMRLRRFVVLPLLYFLFGLGVVGAGLAGRPDTKIPWIFSRICLFACILLTLPGIWWGTGGFTFRYYPSESFRWYLMMHPFLWNFWWLADGALTALARWK